MLVKNRTLKPGTIIQDEFSIFIIISPTAYRQEYDALNVCTGEYIKQYYISEHDEILYDSESI